MRREAEEKARVEADALKAQLEAERRERAESERRASEDAERRERDEADRRAREIGAKEAAERAAEQARREADDRARAEAGALKAQLEEERRARAEAERRADEEAERRASEESHRRAREESEANARRLEDEERARRESDERAVQEENARARIREAEERVRREAEREAEDLKAKLGQETAAREEAQRRAAGDAKRARQESEEKAKAESIERARLDAERRAEQEAQILRQRREDEQRARDEAERQAREQEESARAARQAEEQSRQDALRVHEEEDRANERREAEARAARESAELAERAAVVTVQSASVAATGVRAEAEAVALARKEARARERSVAASKPAPVEVRPEAVQQARYQAPPRHSGGRSPGKIIALGLFGILIAAIVAIHLVTLDPAGFEKAASARFGQPVKIGSVHLALLPLPKVRFDKVTIGTDALTRFESVHAIPELATLREDHKVFKSLDLEGAVIPQAALAALWDKSDASAFRFQALTARGAKFDIPGLAVPALDIAANFGADGSLAQVRAASADKAMSIRAEFSGAEAKIDLAVKAFTFPFGGGKAAVVLDEISARGTLKRDELVFNEIELSALGGTMSGNTRIRWRAGWTLDGELALRRGNVSKLAGALINAGVLEGKAVFAMKAATPDKLLAAPRVEAAFTVQKGTLVGVDLTQVMQSGNASGGSTPFSEISGIANYDSGRVQARQLRLVAGLLNASGSAEVDPQRGIAGRFALELKSVGMQGKATLMLGGTLEAPQFRRN